MTLNTYTFLSAGTWGHGEERKIMKRRQMNTQINYVLGEEIVYEQRSFQTIHKKEKEGTEESERE